jgi:hypothetical protein
MGDGTANLLTVRERIGRFVPIALANACAIGDN